MRDDDLDVTELFEQDEEIVNGIPISFFQKLIAERYADAVPRGVYTAPLGALTGEADPCGRIYLNPEIDVDTVQKNFDLPDPVGSRTAAVITFFHEVGHFKCAHLRNNATSEERNEADMFLSAVTGKVKKLVERIRAQREREADAWALQEFQNLRDDLVEEGIIEMSATEKTEMLRKKQAEIQEEMTSLQAQAAEEAAEKARKEREAKEKQHKMEVQEALSEQKRLGILHGKRAEIDKEISAIEAEHVKHQELVEEARREEARLKLEARLKPLYARLLEVNGREIPAFLNRAYHVLEELASEFDGWRSEEAELCAEIKGLKRELEAVAGTNAFASVHNEAMKALNGRGGPMELEAEMRHLLQVITNSSYSWLWAGGNPPVTRFLNPHYGQYRKEMDDILQIRTPIYRREQPATHQKIVSSPGG